MAASKPLQGTSWLRLIAVGNAVPAEATLPLLWDQVAAALRAQSCHTVMVLVAEQWLPDHLKAMGFAFHEEIITLQRQGSALPEHQPFPVTIRPAEQVDEEAMIAVDHQAFNPPWQMTTEELHQAMRIAYSCTIARRAGEIVGYQISTRHRSDGHLARLAVSPQVQGLGIGSALLHDLIQRLHKRGVTGLTVNTQRSNIRSQRVYTRYGFLPTGYDLPVWARQLEPT
jgi:ribosomal-protein-alanine N-acetyltransferase